MIPETIPANSGPRENYRLKLASFMAADEIKDSLGLTARQFLQIRPIIERVLEFTRRKLTSPQLQRLILKYG